MELESVPDCGRAIAYGRPQSLGNLHLCSPVPLAKKGLWIDRSSVTPDQDNWTPKEIFLDDNHHVLRNGSWNRGGGIVLTCESRRGTPREISRIPIPELTLQYMDLTAQTLRIAGQGRWKKDNVGNHMDETGEMRRAAWSEI